MTRILSNVNMQGQLMVSHLWTTILLYIVSINTIDIYKGHMGMEITHN